MKITLINPPLVAQKGDQHSSGIPYLPYTACYLAALLRGKGEAVSFIDCFGEAPGSRTPFKTGHERLGLTTEETLSRIPDKTDWVILVINMIPKHNAALEILRALKKKAPEIKVAAAGNSISVFCYSMREAAGEILEAGADFVFLGEAERTAALWLEYERTGRAYDEDLLEAGFKTAEGEMLLTEKAPFLNQCELDALPFPAYDLIPLENYWSLGYAHGPQEGPYLALITSRGCPYACAFCSVPASNDRQWRPRSPQNVVEEMIHWQKTLGVREFHLEDLNPTVDKKRIQSLCAEIKKEGLTIIWKLVSGTKVETLDETTLRAMAEAGCRYISISPESGSKRVLQLMKKPFDYDHALKMVRLMHHLGIKTQICFVLGFPGETDEDRRLTHRFMRRIVFAGADEVTFFINTPIPGTASTAFEWRGGAAMEGYTFSPVWREDYKALHAYRNRLYALFCLYKLVSHPLKVLHNVLNVIRGRFELKTEMVGRRILGEILPRRR